MIDGMDDIYIWKNSVVCVVCVVCVVGGSAAYDTPQHAPEAFSESASATATSQCQQLKKAVISSGAQRAKSRSDLVEKSPSASHRVSNQGDFSTICCANSPVGDRSK